MNRVLQATRLHTVVWVQNVTWPWLIMGTSFVINLLVFLAIGDTGPNGNITGGLVSLYSVAAIVAALSITQTFPFALGMGVTRRTFFLATALVNVVQAVAYAIVLYGLNLLEGATNGFGIDLRFFRVPFIDVHNGFLQILVYAVPMLFFNFVCIYAGVVVARFGSNGFFAGGAVVLLVLGGLAALVTWRGWWPDIWHWLSHSSPASLLVGWPALLAALAAVAGLVTIRRANA